MLLKKIPKYAIVPIIIIIIGQFLTYFGTQFINRNLHAYDFTIPAIDNMIPAVNFFITFYVLSYPWWYISPIIVAYTTKKRFYNWFLALIICFAICGVVFILVPTTITRPEIIIENFFDWATNFIYMADNPTRPINLFPSYHVLFSWYCYIGVRGQKNIRLWYRIGAFLFATAISLSTQFVKQHYIIDLVSAILLAEAIFYLVSRYNLGDKLMTKINDRKNKQKDKA